MKRFAEKKRENDYGDRLKGFFQKERHLMSAEQERQKWSADRETGSVLHK